MANLPDHVIPINFTLTARAVENIRSVTERCRGGRMIDPVPAMCWLANVWSSDGYYETFNVPDIGVYERSELPAGAIQTIGGLEMVFAIPPDKAQEFQGRVIDYDSGKGFHFVN